MTALRTKSESKTILDFSEIEINKKTVKEILNNLKLTSIYNKNSYLIVVDNNIKVGNYLVVLSTMLPECFGIFGEQELKKFKSLHVEIFELNKGRSEKLILGRDLRFKNQYWLEENKKSKLKVNHLVDILLHCRRVDKLSAFS